MWPENAVVILPCRQHHPDVGERREQCLVEQIIAQPPVKALDQGALCRLTWRDVVPVDVLLLRPLQDCHAGELGAV